MKKLSTKEIRKIWFDFFKAKGHKIEESSSLIPKDDKTLLFINAGIAPLKKYFDGREIPKNQRIANIQKCIRTNDIENVGLTARHHTFFEMMGNFSIGNYFKEEAIDFAIELLTSDKYYHIPLEKLYITYYTDDKVAYNLWLKKGVSKDHLIPNDNNYWEIGEGPSGPNTEIFYDRGEKYDKRGIELLEKDLENDRYIEIWNIVFSEFNAKEGIARKDYQKLPNQNIDTGAGLERFACIFQDTLTNFETDLFMPIIKEIEKISKTKYDGQMSYKVIADHFRTLLFAVSDGAVLSNEGRGYVLRRLLRRALKHGMNLGLNAPFLTKLLDVTINTYQDIYPNLATMKDITKIVILKEEESFFQTIIEGEKHLKDAIKDQDVLKGEDAFKLYDTYGFPIELTIEYLEEMGKKVDLNSFYLELEKQKIRSKESRKDHSSMNIQNEEYLDFIKPSKFIGYDHLSSKSIVIKVFDEGIVLDKTPFYATSGGQVHDIGLINNEKVIDVIKLPNGQHLHVIKGIFNENDVVTCEVDQNYRNDILKNHTATHLLHQALKDTLGKHVNQQGSLVSNNYLRFDFNHYETPSLDELLKIESLVKKHINLDTKVNIKEMKLNDALKLGANALFGEKYGDVVRVVDIDWSKELCGGTHVKSTHEIIDFEIASFSSIGSGTYRIEAITGNNLSLKIKPYLKSYLDEINEISNKIKNYNEKMINLDLTLSNSFKDVHKYLEELKKLRLYLKEIEVEKSLKEEKTIIKNISIKLENIQSDKAIFKLNLEPKILKQVSDLIYDKIKASVIYLINDYDNKLSFIVKSDGIINAKDLLNESMEIMSGRGGGNNKMAQGGTTNYNNLPKLIKNVSEVLKCDIWDLT